MSTFRSGFACLVGRPNTGKSTLTNALVGQKIAITSSRPQTTRHAVRGIVHRTDAQLVVVDTPGLHRPRTLLGERLGEVVRTTWSEVDVIALCLPADEKIGPGDRRIVEELAGVPGTPVIAVVTKTDVVNRARVAEALLAVQELGDRLGRAFDEIVPVSALAGDERQSQVGLLADLLVARLPEGPPLYPDGELTDEPERTLVAELIREAALEEVRDELPHSLAVSVEEMTPRENAGAGGLVDIHAVLYVERRSQKPIVLGAKGTRIRDIGAAARRQIEALLGNRVYLDLHVSVLDEWQRDPKKLSRLGF